MLNFRDPKYISYISAVVVATLLLFALLRNSASFFYTLFFIIIFALIVFISYMIITKEWKLPNLVIGDHDDSKSKDSNTDFYSLSQSVKPVKSDVKFSDVGGIGEVKEELEEIINFLKNPQKYKKFGARLPRGVLLVGPPGVGKTMIAKAVASEANVPFFYQSGASFVQIYVGMGAKRVHELFESAKNSTPSIIFIDEIDAIGKSRGNDRNDERESTLNQLLTEMDGFNADSNVIVIAATNKIDVLDSALLRSGRFDRRIFVELPTFAERVSIISKYLKKIPNDVDPNEISKITVGFNGAALAALTNEAALLALKKNDIQLKFDHFTSLIDKVMFGKKKIVQLSSDQKNYRARYVAAKAVVSTYNNFNFEKATMTSPDLISQDMNAMIQSELDSMVIFYLSGMISSDMKFKEHSTDAAKDLNEAKNLVKNMVHKYAMGTNILATDYDELEMFERVKNDTVKLLQKLNSVINQVEVELLQFETISKDKIKVMMHDLL